MTDLPVANDSFGTRLRQARQRAGFHTLRLLADTLSTLGIDLSDDAFGHWELDRRRPPERERFLSILALFARRGGFTSLDEVNHLLWLLDWRNLNQAEIDQHFRDLPLPIRNLPSRPLHYPLVGRDAQLTAITDSLLGVNSAPVVVVTGLGGIGKTAIAYEAVRRVMQTQRFTALAWVSLKSEEFEGTSIRARRDQVLSVSALLHEIANQLALDLPPNVEPNILRLKVSAALKAGQTLVVVDNLETLDAARDTARLLYDMVSPSTSSQPSKVLITSREQLLGESYLYHIYLRGLPEPASLELLHREAEHRQALTLLTAPTTLTSRIHHTTGGMPLAIKLIVTQALLGIALDTELDRLHGVTDEEQLYRFLYFTIWQRLGLGAQKTLIAAAAFGTSAQRSHLIRVSQSPTDADFDTSVTELVLASLMDIEPAAEAARQRYSIHAMTRWFVNAPLKELWNRSRAATPADH